MKKKIIAISGKQYSGKDTVAGLLLDKFPEFKRVGIGDAIKLEYGKQKGLSFEEIEANKHLYRSDLIALGNWGREQDPLYWLKKIIDLDYDVIVPDMRVMDELETLKKEDAFLLRVEATKESRTFRGEITNEFDATETALDNYTHWDYVLDNSGDLEALRRNIKVLFNAVEMYF